MSKSNWISKVVRIGAMAAGSAAFVAALVVAGDRMTPATAQAAAMPSLTTNVPELQLAGPPSALCSAVDGRPCLRDGQQIHCANSRGGISTCLCFEREWSCQP
jgi:hypothetical protein